MSLILILVSSPSIVQAMKAEHTARWNLGLFLIFLVALIWTGSSVLVQHIFEGMDFHAPLFLTYVCTSLFAVQLPLWHAAVRLGLAAPLPWRGEGDAYSSLDDIVPAQVIRSAGAGSEEESRGATPPRKARRSVAKIGLLVFPLWFLANYAYNASLSLTSVTSSTGAPCPLRCCSPLPRLTAPQRSSLALTPRTRSRDGFQLLAITRRRSSARCHTTALNCTCTQ